MVEQITRVVIAGVTFWVLDYVWLGLLMRTFYQTHIEAIMVPMSSAQGGIHWVPAFIAYALLALGMVLFVVPRASRFLFSSFAWGALFGLIVYGMYNGTNLALVRQWPLVLVAVDVAWGVVLCGLVSVVTTAFSSRKRRV